MGNRTETGVVIVGTGFSGLGMAIQLRKEGREDFVILEKAHDVGGTWRDNSYPGCACDIPSHMYSFSFEQNPGWSRAYSPQPEIWQYLRETADKHDLRRFVRFGQEMTGARWDAEENRWHVATSGGDEFIGTALVAGVGALHLPMIPELPGIEKFEGPAYHSARWRHDVDLAGKKVAVIGTGASAVQFVPKIAPEVAELTLFQRTPPWIMPKADHEMSGRTRALFKAFPPAQRAYRTLLYWLLEARAIGFNGQSWVMKLGQRLAKRHVDRAITDPALRRKVTPDYTMGCKRVLISNDYYPALARDNVDVVTEGVREVRARSVVDTAGVEHEADVLIYGTGFHVTDAFDDLEIVGRDGRNLGKEWATEGMRTHLGITVEGFPNLFFLLGPNTGLGHNSVVFMIEAQISYIAEALRLARGRAIEPKPEVQERFNAQIQRKLAKGIWTRGGCKSWYLDAKGVNRTIWPGFTWRYWLDTRKVRREDFRVG
ncbi:flavin-binding monooxygenase-like protein [Amycolatopsis mediterranei S699]|uniref:Flavin-binding monooxygenase-like protein n=2 Tax=Amycolatopsis mediterranei TaxID=33910 RepID=A0A0H3DGZ9_AMYMU|nr:NAD(P)/FAD-dependent oxidoreductase [Amycolatopsis mediterranei]ADJ49398.1 flavin-binding monooxygenase-like protein [Amycolatopsis mediterranei U32]AEK46369.1 flavin-binding monooxygenase-like protein [Amycolatopsis mediterranei S699]AFO81106.1 flavin-binding monooxygenase-like protein [Amycolatopsis mediterranei S699]AGT88234.1 flavin-binding monooxygenase-like protein [Amycolatopsis mediterranei RB]KDO09346.1 4-hydroxyacetophenone monooxygenase [Amycolatopsis mediterranei]